MNRAFGDGGMGFGTLLGRALGMIFGCGGVAGAAVFRDGRHGLLFCGWIGLWTTKALDSHLHFPLHPFLG